MRFDCPAAEVPFPYSMHGWAMPGLCVTSILVVGACAARRQRRATAALVLVRRLGLPDDVVRIAVVFDDGQLGRGVQCGWGLFFRERNPAVVRPMGSRWVASLGPPVPRTLLPPAAAADSGDSRDHAIAADMRDRDLRLVVKRIPCSARCVWLPFAVESTTERLAVTVPDMQTDYIGVLGCTHAMYSWPGGFFLGYVPDYPGLPPVVDEEDATFSISRTCLDRL